MPGLIGTEHEPPCLEGNGGRLERDATDVKAHLAVGGDCDALLEEHQIRQG